VAAQLLRQAGFKVDLQAMDWQTLVGRRAKKDAPDKGGWHMFLTAWQAPLTSGVRSPTRPWTRGAKSRLVRLGQGRQADRAAQPVHARHRRRPAKKKLADQIHTRAFEVGTHAPLGEYDAADGRSARTSAASS
jgi:peptide/nickel transport system substrate-binding protein